MLVLSLGNKALAGVVIGLGLLTPLTFSLVAAIVKLLERII